MRTKWGRIAAVAALAVLLCALAYLLALEPGPRTAGIAAGGPDAPDAPRDLALDEVVSETGGAVPGAGQPGSGEAADAQAAAYLQEQFGATIANKHTQIKALEKLIAYLMKAYPDDWRDRVYDLLRAAFPERADELYAQFAKLSAYNDWLAGHRGELMMLDPALRRAKLWELRRRFFGDDVDEIWETALRNEQIYDALDAIGRSSQSSVAEKIELYVESVKQAYGDLAERFMEQRRSELVNRFLSVETVQDDLHGLAPQQRAVALDDIRRAMGMDEPALQRWRELDSRRDADWDLGRRYMEQREAIVAGFEGPERDRRLQTLRESMFAEQAESLRSEEAAGFFRFGHRRVFGKE